MRPVIQALLTTVLASKFVTGCGPNIDQTPRGQISLHAADSLDPTIRNFQRVNDQLYRSGRLTDRNYANLAARGVNTVISFEEYNSPDLTLEQEKSWAEKNQIKLISFPLSDRNPPTTDQIETVLKELNNRENGTILVHCHRGADRTGIIIASYRIRFNFWSVELAIREMKKYGHSRQLYWWDDVLYDFAGEARPHA